MMLTFDKLTPLGWSRDQNVCDAALDDGLRNKKPSTIDLCFLTYYSVQRLQGKQQYFVSVGPGEMVGSPLQDIFT